MNVQWQRFCDLLTSRLKISRMGWWAVKINLEGQHMHAGMSFLTTLARSETQSYLSRIRTQITDFILYDTNRFTTWTFLVPSTLNLALFLYWSTIMIHLSVSNIQIVSCQISYRTINTFTKCIRKRKRKRKRKSRKQYISQINMFISLTAMCGPSLKLRSTQRILKAFSIITYLSSYIQVRTWLSWRNFTLDKKLSPSPKGIGSLNWGWKNKEILELL